VSESCTIILTDANNLVRGIHDPMPVIVGKQNYQPWLDPANKNADARVRMLKPTGASRWTMHQLQNA
jgi:putative SOS response-associated peptidase YedK